MRWDEVPGWTNFEDVYDLAVAEARDGSVFVEIGTWMGRSAAYMGMRIAESGKRIQFFAIDTFRGSPGTETSETIFRLAEEGKTLEEICKENLTSCGVQHYVQLIASDSVEASHAFMSGTVDFCMIDAAHDYESVKRDIESWLPKMRQGGLLAGDDIRVVGVKKAVEEKFGSAWVMSKMDAWPAWMVRIPTN